MVEKIEQRFDVKHNLVLDGTKLPWHYERVKAWLEGERIAPITVEWALTRTCTYNCWYCNYGYGPEDRDERPITKQAAFNFLKDAAEIGVKAVPIGCDGESTCSPWLYDLIPYTTEVGLDTAMSTNGFLLDDSKLGIILPHLTYLRVNISAASPHRYAEIMGTSEKNFLKVYNTVKKCVEIKRDNGLKVTLGLQMVCPPHFKDQIIPMAKLGKELGVDYTVIKHCSDNPEGSLGIDYSKYEELRPVLKEAESFSTDNYLVKAKWSKMLSRGVREYKDCYGPLFLQQVSGSGLVGICGTFFKDDYKDFHVGNILDQRYKDLLKSEKYWKVINYITSDKFSNKACWSLCFQHKVNQFLWKLKQIQLEEGTEKALLALRKSKPDDFTPQHINFV